MTGKTLTLAAIVGSLLIGTSATAVLARQEAGRGPGGAGMFVHMLQEFDTNKDGRSPGTKPPRPATACSRPWTQTRTAT